MIVDKNFEYLSSRSQEKSRCCYQGATFFRHSPTIKGVPFVKYLQITFWVGVLWTKVQVGMIFNKKYFYRLLSAINSNIVNSIDFWYNMDDKTFMQSSGINVFIGAYWQLTMSILLSILLIFNNIITLIINIHAEMKDKYFKMHLFLKRNPNQKHPSSKKVVAKTWKRCEIKRGQQRMLLITW